jgi:hypothetical protein
MHIPSAFSLSDNLLYFGSILARDAGFPQAFPENVKGCPCA